METIRPNKGTLIKSPASFMKTKSYSVLQTESDADTVFVTAALDQVKHKNPAVIVDQGTDPVVIVSAVEPKDSKELGSQIEKNQKAHPASVTSTWRKRLWGRLLKLAHWMRHVFSTIQ